MRVRESKCTDFSNLFWGKAFLGKPDQYTTPPNTQTQIDPDTDTDSASVFTAFQQQKETRNETNKARLALHVIQFNYRAGVQVKRDQQDGRNPLVQALRKIQVSDENHMNRPIPWQNCTPVRMHVSKSF